MRYIVYDGETRSTTNLRHVGSHIYLCNPTTEVWCVSYCIVTDDVRGPISTWTPPQPIPPEILEAAAEPQTLVVAFNDAFERQLEMQILHPRYGWPIFPIERRRCAQAIALTHALPASLDAVAEALKLKTRKTAAGTRAMKLLARPRRPRKGEDPSQIYWHNDPKQLQILYEYNQIDVEITADIVAQLGFIPPQEQQVWQLDAAINARGIRIDAGLLDAGIRIGEQADVELREKIAALTDGEITSPAQVDRILKWLAQHGCELANIQEDTLLEALKRPGLPPATRQLIGLRLDGAHAAVNKLDTLRRWLGPDHRIRHAYRYHGAMPGRFTSIGAQMQNLKKPIVDDIGAAIDTVHSGSLTQMQARYERPLSIVGDITRALVVAAPGHRLFIADLSGIESRGLAWLCNEQTKLDAWREFDRTSDPTKEPYHRFGVEDLNLEGASARKTSKTCDLAFGYQGLVGAWRRLAPPEDNTPDEKVLANRRAWVRRHPNVEKFWSVSVRQAINAIENAGAESFTVARLSFQRDGHFLHLKLPSGRFIRYPYARIYADERSKSFTFRDASGGRWEWHHVLKGGRGAFGGLIAENATQALCRDIFVEAMLRLEAAGYHIVAHLHDEFVCEVPNGFGSQEEFLAIITQPPAWAPDLPIAAKARITDRLIEIKTPIAGTVNGGINDAKPNDALADLLADDAEFAGHLDSDPSKITNPRASCEVELEAEYCAPVENLKNPGGSKNSNAETNESPSDQSDDPPPRGNGRDSTADQYPAGEQPHGAPKTNYVYKDARGFLYMRVTVPAAKLFRRSTGMMAAGLTAGRRK